MMALFVTADGAIKFQEIRSPEPIVYFAIFKRLSPLKEDPLDVTTAIPRRAYELWGQEGDVSIYKEIVS
jgi:hypothetical protein